MKKQRAGFARRGKGGRLSLLGEFYYTRIPARAPFTDVESPSRPVYPKHRNRKVGLSTRQDNLIAVTSSRREKRDTYEPVNAGVCPFYEKVTASTSGFSRFRSKIPEKGASLCDLLPQTNQSNGKNGEHSSNRMKPRMMERDFKFLRDVV